MGFEKKRVRFQKIPNHKDWPNVYIEKVYEIKYKKYEVMEKVPHGYDSYVFLTYKV